MDSTTTLDITNPTTDQIRSATEALGDLRQWFEQCHAASVCVVRSGALGPNARVARGWHANVKSQHSWVVVGDPYDPNVFIFDATLWGYVEVSPRVFYGASCLFGTAYRPHGYGVYMDHGPFPQRTGDVVVLDTTGLSDKAKDFLSMFGPFDMRGWHHIAHMPVRGWPAKEIITAMRKDPRLKAMVPIDVAGMLTDENPQGLYW